MSRQALLSDRRTARGRGARPGWLGALAALLLALSACSAALPGLAAPEQTQPVLTETAQLLAVYAPPPRATAIEEAAALQKASLVMMRADQATAVRARQALLSLRQPDGTVTMAPRHAWLVTYEGVSFSASPTCSCHLQTLPDTTVVLDATSGQVLMAYGSSGRVG